jgi:hypothetical protein
MPAILSDATDTGGQAWGWGSGLVGGVLDGVCDDPELVEKPGLGRCAQRALVGGPDRLAADLAATRSPENRRELIEHLNKTPVAVRQQGNRTCWSQQVRQCSRSCREGKLRAARPGKVQKRDSLYVLDVLYDRDGGKRPEMIVTDTASYSDIVFGLLTLAGFAYAPQLADLPDQKMWRIDRAADYGAFQDAARGRVDLARVERHWEDILRIIGSIHTEAVRRTTSSKC